MTGYRWQRRGLALAVSAVLMLAAGCQSRPKEEGEGEKPGAAKTEEAATPGTDAAFLMAMTWEEAKAVSAQTLEVPSICRLAAEEVRVLKAAEDGTPERVRARGKVYVETMGEAACRVLCQEAYLSDDELILRGKPLLQRGGSVVEGLDDVTVIYMIGSRLRVIGKHQVTNQSAMLEEMQRTAGGGRGAGFETPGPAPLLPILSGPWGGGPNPLLPPLSSDSVPEEIRQKMRAEAEAVEVIPLEIPGEAVTGPPMTTGTKLVTPHATPGAAKKEPLAASPATPDAMKKEGNAAAPKATPEAANKQPPAKPAPVKVGG